MVVGLTVFLLGQIGNWQDRAALYVWFDSLGYEAVVKGKFVGLNLDPANQPEAFNCGFLETRDGPRFKFLTVRLARRHEPTPEDPYSPPNWYPLDIEKWARQKIADTDKGNPEGLSTKKYVIALDRADAFVLARALDARGKHKLADAVVRAGERNYKKSWAESGVPYVVDVKNFIGNAAFREATEDGDRVSVPRIAMQRNLESFVAKFPSHRYAPVAKQAALTYARMVKEDIEHAKRPTIPLEKMPARERVAELIFRLRDAHAPRSQATHTMPSFLYHRVGDRTQEKSAQSQLVALGFDAVPQLIDAVIDKRFARGYVSNWDERFPVMRVHDVAVEILEKIAGRSFEVEPNFDEDDKFDLDRLFRTQQDSVRAWWKEVSVKGEKAVLKQAVQAGGEDIGGQADRLVTAYPEVAVQAISDGLKNSKSHYPRFRLVAALGKLATDDALELLRTCMLSDADPYLRLDAARILFLRDPPLAFKSMVREWESTDNSGDDGLAIIAGSDLFMSGKAEGVVALARGLETKSPYIRGAVARAIAWNGLGRFNEMIGGQSTEKLRQSVEGRAYLAEAERLLVSFIVAMETRPAYFGESQSSKDKSPLFGDAADSLSHDWPTKYRAASPESDVGKRNLAVSYANLWRKEHGQDPLDFPRKLKTR